MIAVPKKGISVHKACKPDRYKGAGGLGHLGMTAAPEKGTTKGYLSMTAWTELEAQDTLA
jgi:hypothetical protein